MLESVNAVELLTAAGVLPNGYWSYRLNSKFDALTGRVSELSAALVVPPAAQTPAPAHRYPAGAGDDNR